MLKWLKNKFKKKDVEPLPVKVTEFDLEIPWDRNGVRLMTYNGSTCSHRVSKELYDRWKEGIEPGVERDYAWHLYCKLRNELDRQVNRRYYEMGGK